MRRRRLALAAAVCVFALLVSGCVGQTDDRTDTTVVTHASVTDFSVTDRGCTAGSVNDIDSEIERDDGGGVVVGYSRNVSLPDAGQGLGEPRVEAVNGSTFAFDVPVEEAAQRNGSCTAEAYARYDASIQLPSSDGPWRLVVLHDGARVGSISSGDGGSNATARTGGGSSSEDRDSASSDG